MDKLVSIITPCFNGGKYLDRFFQSILVQTYPAVELIFVNDGSTDRTEKMALAYGNDLKRRGYSFIYIRQENAGQSAAINQGLKLFSGEYLNWTDSDDYLPPDSIEKRVLFLETNQDIGLVIGRSVIVNDSDYKQIGVIEETGFERTGIKALVDDFLKGDISCTACCSTMVRASMFRDAMPDPPQIETPREIGQNYQLFLPIMFKYPTRYIPDVLGYYVVHADSHSHARKSFEQRLHIRDVATTTLNSIANRIPVGEEERAWFKSKIEEYDCRGRLDVLQHYHRKDGVSDIVRRLKQIHKYDLKARKQVLKIKFPLIKTVSDRLWSLRNR